MEQAAKAQKAITQRRPKNIQRNSAHNNARKDARKDAVKNSFVKRKKGNSDKPPINKPSKIVIEKRSKTLNKQSKKLTSNTVKRRRSKSRPQSQIPKIDFIMQHRADNILYYTQGCENYLLFSDDRHCKSKTPIVVKSFAPLPAVREPLSEYIMLQRKRKAEQSAQDRDSKKTDNTAILNGQKSDPSKPLPRSTSPTLSNAGALEILANWFRISHYKILNIFNYQTQETIKKRSKADILNEIAGLRAENAMLRKKLNKKLMPFGRKNFEV